MGDVFLVHHSRSGLTPLVSGILRGAQLECFRAILTIWDRFRSGRITFLYSVPPVWSALMDYYLRIISNLTPKHQKAHRQGAHHIRSEKDDKFGEQ